MIFGQAIKPLYYFEKTICLWPFSLVWEGGLQIQTRFSILSNIYTISLIFAYFLWHLATIFANPLIKDNALGFILDTYGQYSAMSLMLVLALLRIVKQNKMMQIIEIVQDFDNRFFEHFSTDINNIPWLKKITGMATIGIILVGCIERWNCIMFVRETPIFSSFCLLMCFIPHWYAWFAEMQYLSFLLLVKERFVALGRQVDKVVGRKKQATSLYIYCDEFKFSKVVELHERLEKTCGLINSTFGIQNMLVSIYQFIMTITLVYDL